jgi:phosphoserine phosphatase
VTAQLFTALAETNVSVLDVEQVVIRGRLVLGVLLGTDDADDAHVVERVREVGAALEMTVEAEVGHDEDDPRRRGRLHVSVVAEPMVPAALAAVAAELAALGANIDSIIRLSRNPVTCIELEVSGAEPKTVRGRLAAIAATHRIDIAVQPSGLLRRAKRLVVMDVDSTLIQDEVIEMLAERAGFGDHVAAVTSLAMSGELDFESALRQRVRLLAGLPVSVLDDVRREVRLTPGARTLVRTLQRLDHAVAAVSGGFSQVVEPIARELGLTYWAANELEVVDGVITGELVGPIIDRAGKAAALQRFAADAGVPLAQTVAIGDGANDLDMLSLAGLGIAFNAHPVVQQAADTSVTVPFLDTVLFLLGITREEVEQVDAADST